MVPQVKLFHSFFGRIEGTKKIFRSFYKIFYSEFVETDENYQKYLVIKVKVQRTDLTCHMIRKSLRLCCVDQSGMSIQILPEPPT